MGKILTIATTDPIADMLSRIRNAIGASHREVRVPYSKLKEQLAGILRATKFLENFKIDKDTRELILELYKEGKNPRITQLVRISKPSRRVYVGCGEIPSVRGGRGIVIISTSAGILTGQEAKKRKLGGELICKVY